MVFGCPSGYAVATWWILHRLSIWIYSSSRCPCRPSKEYDVDWGEVVKSNPISRCDPLVWQL